MCPLYLGSLCHSQEAWRARDIDNTFCTENTHREHILYREHTANTFYTEDWRARASESEIESEGARDSQRARAREREKRERECARARERERERERGERRRERETLRAKGGKEAHKDAK